MMEPFDFSTGTTNPETFPTELFADAAAAAVRSHAVELNTYPGKLGHLALRELMVQRELDREGFQLDPARVMLTNGSMQAVTLIAEEFCRDGGVVLMEEFCYAGTISAYNALNVETVAVPMDGHGMRTDALASTLARLRSEKRRVAFIYTLPTYQNPTGAVMPRERRLELLQLANEFDTLVVEDNCYADVHYEDTPKPPALYTLNDRVQQIYICSLSKIFAPGVRLGYVTASTQALFDRIVSRRHDAGPNTLAAAIAHEYLHSNLWSHCQTQNNGLKKKRDAMLSALHDGLGNTCSWSHPAGGMFIWVHLPPNVDPHALQAKAAEQEVSIALGADFHVNGDNIPYIRLAFGFAKEKDIHEGIARLSTCILELTS